MKGVLLKLINSCSEKGGEETNGQKNSENALGW